MAERDVRAKVGYVFDPRGSKEFVQANENMLHSTQRVENELLEYSAATRLGVASTRLAFENTRTMVAQLDAQTQAEQRVTDAIQDETRATQQAVKAQQQRREVTPSPGAIGSFSAQDVAAFRGFQRENRLQSAALSSLGNILPGGGGAAFTQFTGLFDLLDDLPKLDLAFKAIVNSVKDNIAAIGLGGVGLIGAIGLLTIALKAFEVVNEQSARLIHGLIGSQGDYFRVVTAGTRDQVQAARDAQQVQVDILRAQVDENRNILAQFEGQVGGVGRGIADVFNLAGVQELRNRTQELEGQLTSAEFLTGRYNVALATNATATADAAAAEQRLSEIRLNALRQQLSTEEQQALLELDLSRQIRAGTSAATEQEAQAARQAIAQRLERAQEEAFAYQVLSDQIQRRINDIQTTIDLLQANPNAPGYAQALEEANVALGIAQQQQTGYQGKLNDLNRTIEILLPGLGLVDRHFRDIEKSANILNRILQIGASFGRVFSAIREDLSGIDVSKQLAKIGEITQRRDERIAELQSQRLEREEQAEKQFAKATADADRKAGDDRLKLFEDTYKRIGEIERRFTRSFTQAVGERDALAAFQATQARADELRDLRDSHAEREREVQRTLERERQVADEARREALAAAQDTVQKQIDQERQKSQALIDEQRRSIDTQLRQAFSFTHTLDSLFNTGYNQILNNAQTFANRLATVFVGTQRPQGGAISNLINALSGGSQTPPRTAGSATNPQNFASSYNAATGTPQQITLPNGQRQIGYVVMNQTIVGNTAQQLRQRIDAHSQALLRRMTGE